MYGRQYPKVATLTICRGLHLGFRSLFAHEKAARRRLRIGARLLISRDYFDKRANRIRLPIPSMANSAAADQSGAGKGAGGGNGASIELAQ